jgi:uncharacterized protein YdiU (UPF0061 family)
VDAACDEEARAEGEALPRVVVAGDDDGRDAEVGDPGEHVVEELDRLGGRDRVEVAAEMDAVNPIFIPRNHLVEAALDAATAGDLGPFERHHGYVTDPFTQRSGREYEEPAPDAIDERFRTICGT